MASIPDFEDPGVAPMDPESFTESSINSTGNATNITICTNDYCVPDEEYVNMIQNYVKPTPSEWILIIVYLMVFVVGIAGNFLVCFAVWKNHSMRTVTNYFIGKLLNLFYFIIIIYKVFVVLFCHLYPMIPRDIPGCRDRASNLDRLPARRTPLANAGRGVSLYAPSPYGTQFFHFCIHFH